MPFVYQEHTPFRLGALRVFIIKNIKYADTHWTRRYPMAFMYLLLSVIQILLYTKYDGTHILLLGINMGVYEYKPV